MAGRRAVTEGIMLDDDENISIDINNLRDDEMKALALAYAMREGAEDDDCQTDEEDEMDEENEHDSDVDDIDPQNFKGIYFNDDPNRKYQDPETGCHFEYYDLCKRLTHLKEKRKILDKQLGIDSADSP